MEPILSRTEIAELLEAIHSGKISIDEGEGRQGKECKEVNLFQLARPAGDRVKIPNFDIIMDSFSRHYSILLSNQLQRTISITRTKLASFDFQEVFEKLAQPGAIGLLDLQPLKQGGLVIFDPKLSFSLIERMLGASPELQTVCLNREPSTIELNVLKVIFDHACSAINKAFSPLIPLNSSVVKVDSNPRLMSITDPDAEVISCTFTINMGQDSGEIRLLFPFASLEVLYEDLQHLLRVNSKRTTTWQESLAHEVEEMTVTLTAQPGTLELTIGDILALNPGDVLELDYDPSKPLKVLVENKAKFEAISGTHNGQKALSITQRV